MPFLVVKSTLLFFFSPPLSLLLAFVLPDDSFASHSGWNHSGKFGTVGFLNGVMGIVNAERTLNLIRTLAEFISLPGNSEVRLFLFPFPPSLVRTRTNAWMSEKQVIPMFSVLNEPFLHVIGIEAITSLYVSPFPISTSPLRSLHFPLSTAITKPTTQSETHLD